MLQQTRKASNDVHSSSDTEQYLLFDEAFDGSIRRIRANSMSNVVNSDDCDAGSLPLVEQLKFARRKG
ncbi:hypothetical protein GM527_13230 [Streptococcus pneumoniae]|nr:hypothetical protein [Streptococcus pneumoniae]